MKPPFTIYDLRFTIWKKPAASVAGNHQSSIVNHKSQQGVALIITLILLSVVTFMAITFLALSRRERSAVSTVTDTASARLAADAALANAEAQVIANVLSTTNPFNFTLLVSTNYINPNGFQPGVSSFTNVNYDHRYNSSVLLNLDDFLQNLTNLYYSPRPPVFIPNPTNSSLPPDFRYYLDLNRNGRYDTNGWVTNVDNNLNGLGTTNFQVGDPEWIGVLERPDAPYGPNNKFIARYAFIAVPVGNTLDLNAIHNQTLNRSLATTPSSDGYFRNQGVGSWEINLAAFLADLNTNEWDSASAGGIYLYQQPIGFGNNGAAFADAFVLLTNRYAGNYGTLASVDTLFGGSSGPGDIAFRNDNIDGYSDGLLQTGFPLPGDIVANDNPSLPWAGADNTNRFFTHQELFNPNESSIAFMNRLSSTRTNVSTYDRYTFYRLLSQLGTDSTPESGKMNLNYMNVDTNGNVVPGMETNFIAWTNALQFFTNAADRLLRAYTTQWRNSNPTSFATNFYSVPGYFFTNANFSATNFASYPAFGIGNIPVLVSNRFVYSSAVNRLLQLAANTYDATTNNAAVIGKNYPSVFRPIFWVTNENNYTNVYINGYQQVVLSAGTNDVQLYPPKDVTQLQLFLGSSVVNFPITGVNVYGVPWIIGAKKDFPNFNEFSMESIVWVERKLEITRPATNSPLSDYQTNQMYFLAISNVLGVECWNSYNSNYTSSSQIQIVARDNLSMMLTNEETGGFMMSPVTWNKFMGNSVPMPLQGGYYTWLGSAPWSQLSTPPSPNPNSFQMPFSASIILPLSGNPALTTNGVSLYVYQTHSFIPAEDPDNTTNYVDKGIVPMPQFGLLTTNRLQVFMLDGNHVIDYVQFVGPDSSRNINAEIADYDPSNPDIGLWNTNFFGASTTPWGVVNQIYYALNPQQNKKYLTGNDDATWRNPKGDGTVGQEIAGLNAFLNSNHQGSGTDPNTGNTYYATNMGTNVQVSFPASRTVYQYISWQANDPLVHYMASDLNFAGPAQSDHLQPGTHIWNNPGGTNNLLANNLGLLNDRYQPWGVNLYTAGADNDPCNLAYKDPLVRQSDNWDFPTNKFPGIGWLGRVHRGTPWQSVYLKAPTTGLTNWMIWTGDTNSYDANNSAPVHDRLLFDLFTAAFNDNATRGTLSVNVEAGLTNNPVAGLAAWSALFSGVVTLTNNMSDKFAQTNVQYQYLPPRFTSQIISPAGVYNPLLPLVQQPALVQIVQGINQTRADTNLFPLQTFTHVGDILAAPQLTEQSPFLHLSNFLFGAWVNDPYQKTNGISDEMYEWLPQQTMSLLRCSDSPRYVIYCYGQALKPAPNGIYTGTTTPGMFGLVTNYQVVSEIATRAVVRFNSTLTNVVTFTNDVSGNPIWFTVPVVTNNNAVIESFNLLPPD